MERAVPRTRVHRYKELHLRQLRAFCECVRRKTFAAAARFLNTSQAAVWQQVRALEHSLGASLLVRHGRAFEPSEDGQLLLEMASSLVGAADSLHEAFVQRRAEVWRRLTVVGSPGVIAEELARPVVEFCRQYPRIKVALPTYTGTRLVESVVSGDADMAILPFAWPESRDAELVSELLCVRPAALAVAEGHPLAGRRRIALADIVRYPLVLPESASEWRMGVDAVFKNAGLLSRMQVVAETGVVQAARRYVSWGLGIALLPQPQDALEVPQVVLRPVGHLFPAEEVGIFWRRGAAPRAQARLFADFIRERLASKERPRPDQGRSR